MATESGVWAAMLLSAACASFCAMARPLPSHVHSKNRRKNFIRNDKNVRPAHMIEAAKLRHDGRSAKKKHDFLGFVGMAQWRMGMAHGSWCMVQGWCG